MRLKLLTTIDGAILTSFRCQPRRFVVWNDAPFLEARLADVGPVFFPLLDVNKSGRELKLYVYTDRETEVAADEADGSRSSLAVARGR